MTGPWSEVLIRRLNRAIAPDYEVIRELGGGGMGFVYLARDRALDRVVAIKAIRPELATEAAVTRFLREARLLGRIRHPNIIPVHRAGTADGLPYYVMEYVEGETLADRLKAGPLSEREAVTVGRALLDALAAAHAAGVVHRDVKPANIFLSGGRVLLGDFGVARVETRDPDATSTSGWVGTPAYMAPEQAAGAVATEQTDIYAAGMVIYEALTGRRWTAVADPKTADWSGVPRRYRRALSRALGWDPERRWHRASAFRRVLSPRYRILKRVTVSGWAFALLVVAVVVTWALVSQRGAPRAGPADVAIVPLTSELGSDPDDGRVIAGLIDLHLSGIPQLSRTPKGQVLHWWNAASEVVRGAESDRCRSLTATWCTGGTVRAVGDSLEMRLYLLNESGLRESEMPRTRAAGPGAKETLAEHGARWLLDELKPDLGGSLRSNSALSADLDARALFYQGENAFYRDRPDLAIAFYTQALNRDSTFALARWHRVQAQRWLPAQPFDLQPDLERLARAEPGRLDRLDSLLVHAQLQPAGDDRLNAYRDVARAYSGDALPWMLWGEELFHRGPLAGHPVDTAAAILEEATRLDPQWPPPRQLLAWLHIRQGRRAEARSELDRLRQISPAAAAGQPSYTDWLEQAWREKFDPEAAAFARAQLLGAPAELQARRADFPFRMPFAFDLPDIQAAFGRIAMGTGLTAARASGLYALALADAACGRGASALLHLDSATAIADTDSARLHAAEWRVIPAALGVPLFAERERDAGRTALRGLATNPDTRMRAVWALALDAAAADPRSANAWRDSLARTVSEQPAGAARGSVGSGLLEMLDAAGLAAAGDVEAALYASERLLFRDAQGRHGDPFARSALHLLRADWHAQAGDSAAAERDLRWAENLDITGWPAGQPQSVEIDWMFSVQVSLRRARLALTRNEAAAACAQLARALRFWTDVDPEHEAPKREAERLHGLHCPR